MKNLVDFPTEEWMEEYGNSINESDDYAEAGEGWGTDYDGSFVFIVEDLPLDDISTEDLPENIKKQLDEYVSDNTVYAYLGLKDGECTGTEVLKSIDDKEHGFELSGPYENWKKLIKGKLDVVKAMMGGDLDLDGDMSKIMKYTKAAKILGDLAGQVPDTEFLDEKYV